MNTGKKTSKPKPDLIDTLIELADWTLRYSTDTAEQKLALEAKEKLEQWRMQWRREREAQLLPKAA
jgi:hypothetical protein